MILFPPKTLAKSSLQHKSFQCLLSLFKTVLLVICHRFTCGVKEFPGISDTVLVCFSYEMKEEARDWAYKPKKGNQIIKRKMLSKWLFMTQIIYFVFHLIVFHKLQQTQSHLNCIRLFLKFALSLHLLFACFSRCGTYKIHCELSMRVNTLECLMMSIDGHHCTK